MNAYDRIKERRIKLGMSQEELAQKAGYNGRSMISRIEKGDVDLQSSKLVQIAQALRCSPGYILFGDESQEIIEKIRDLDEYDTARVSAYIDGLLDADKYKKDTESRAM